MRPLPLFSSYSLGSDYGIEVDIDKDIVTKDH